MYDHDLGVPIETGIVRMTDQLPETRTEGLLRFDRDVLVPEEDDLVLHERIVDGPLGDVVHRLQVDAIDLGAQDGRKGIYRKAIQHGRLRGAGARVSGISVGDGLFVGNLLGGHANGHRSSLATCMRMASSCTSARG